MIKDLNVQKAKVVEGMGTLAFAKGEQMFSLNLLLQGEK